jgi:hypothetical protein
MTTETDVAPDNLRAKFVTQASPAMGDGRWGDVRLRAIFKRSAACLLASTALLLTGCAVSPAQSSNEGSAAAADTKAADSKPSTPAFDYGPVAGTFTIHVANTDGYTATIKAVMHKPTLVSSTKEMPSWCPPHFSNGNSNETLTEASSIISQTVEASVTLDDRPGFPAPSKWAPTVETSTGVRGPDGGSDPYAGYGECSSNSAGGVAPTLTSEGYQAVFSDVAYGRSTPAKPLPTKIEDARFYNHYSMYVKGAAKCSMEPVEGFTFLAGHNSPELNNGGCQFFAVPAVPKAG